MNGLTYPFFTIEQFFSSITRNILVDEELVAISKSSAFINSSFGIIVFNK